MTQQRTEVISLSFFLDIEYRKNCDRFIWTDVGYHVSQLHGHRVEFSMLTWNMCKGKNSICFGKLILQYNE